jgi:hypothetical protein
MTDEARLEVQGAGLAPVTDGSFVVNLREAAWERNDHFGGSVLDAATRKVKSGTHCVIVGT